MEDFKRSLKRLLTRLTILGLVVACGAFAIAQAQKQRVTEAIPDLGAPDPTLDEPSPTGFAALQKVRDPESQTQWADDRELPQQEPPRFVEDDFVQPAQAISDVQRFQPPPLEQLQPVDVDPGQDRFESEATTDQFEQSDRFAQGALQPPDLIEETEIPVQNSDDFAQPREADFPAIDQGFPDDLPPTFQEQPAALASPAVASPAVAQPAVVEPPASTEVGFSNDRFGAQTTSGNPIRQGQAATPARVQPPPLSYDTPRFNAAELRAPELEEAEMRAPELDAVEPLADEAGSQSSFTPGPKYAATELDVPGGNRSSISLSGAGKPGPRELEGPQTPSLTIRKIAPSNVRVGAPAMFQVRVRNNGPVPAERVLIRDEVPRGTQLVETNPQASPSSAGAVLWEIGTLRPGEDVTVSMQVTPLQEGPIGSVASVTFQTLASAQADVKRPMLKIEHSTKQQVLLGETVTFAIVLENPGSGSAEKVTIEEDVPAGLAHTKGPKLEYEVGSIPAGASRRLELSLKAAKPGIVENVIRARGAGGLVAEHRIELEVISPQLQVKIKGPNRRYLEREAAFSLAIENAGTATANNVELIAKMPRGLKFVSTNNSGRFDPASNTIRWSLDQLPAQRFGEVKFTAVPTNTGELTINAEATADRGLRDAKDHSLVVNGIAALLVEVADQVDPIEVGASTTYNIRVKNQGTKHASNVKFVALVPPGMRPVAASGPTNYRVEGDHIFFDSIARLAPKAESSFNVRVEGIAAGDQRFRVQMTSDDTTSPVVEEESTKVYAD